MGSEMCIRDRDEMLEAAALPALMIVMAGLFPVILMNGMLRRAG